MTSREGNICFEIFSILWCTYNSLNAFLNQEWGQDFGCESDCTSSVIKGDQCSAGESVCSSFGEKSIAVWSELFFNKKAMVERVKIGILAPRPSRSANKGDFESNGFPVLRFSDFT